MGLAVPAGAVKIVTALPEVSIVTTASAWLSSRPNRATASRACASVTMTGRLRRASSMIRDSRPSWPVVVYLASFGGRNTLVPSFRTPSDEVSTGSGAGATSRTSESVTASATAMSMSPTLAPGGRARFTSNASSATDQTECCFWTSATAIRAARPRSSISGG